MNEAPEDLHQLLDQLRLLATETADPLAERLVRDVIVELEDQLRADSKGASGSSIRQFKARLHLDRCRQRPPRRPSPRA